jgi:hypothetical protein
LIVCALEATAAVERASGNTQAARYALEEARRTGRTGAVPGSYVASVTRALGELTGDTGRYDEAVELLEAAMDYARYVGDSWEAARGSAALERLQAHKPTT